MTRMGYRAAIEFAADNGEQLATTYDYGYEGARNTKAEILSNAAGDIMVYTIAAIFGREQKAVAAAIMRKQRADG